MVDRDQRVEALKLWNDFLESDPELSKTAIDKRVAAKYNVKAGTVASWRSEHNRTNAAAAHAVGIVSFRQMVGVYLKGTWWVWTIRVVSFLITMSVSAVVAAVAQVALGRPGFLDTYYYKDPLDVKVISPYDAGFYAAISDTDFDTKVLQPYEAATTDQEREEAVSSPKMFPIIYTAGEVGISIRIVNKGVGILAIQEIVPYDIQESPAINGVYLNMRAQGGPTTIQNLNMTIDGDRKFREPGAPKEDPDFFGAGGFDLDGTQMTQYKLHINASRLAVSFKLKIVYEFNKKSDQEKLLPDVFRVTAPICAHGRLNYKRAYVVEPGKLTPMSDQGKCI